jgi:uncharacterized membrane protein (UPF0127 family)
MVQYSSLYHLLVGLMAAAVLPACAADRVEARPAPYAACAPTTPEAKRAKPGSVERLDIATARGPVRLQVEIADTEAERAQGLMCRRSMAPDRGMLFDFKTSRPVYFWMKNTLIPLDMVFIDQDGRIVAVAANTTPLSTDPVGPGAPVLAVLELAAGRAAALGIAPGDRMKHRIFSAH